MALDPQDPLELRDLSASRDQQGHGVMLVPKVLRARKDKLVLQANLVSRETMGRQDQLVSLVPEVTLVHLEVQEYKGLQVSN